MADWVRVCSAGEVPQPGEATEVAAKNLTLCLANVDGELSALDNWCPHRQGPLGQGWVEGKTVVCPWHAWAFDCRTGVAEPPETAHVKVFPIREENGEIEVNLG